MVELNVKFAGLDMSAPVGVSAQAPFCPGGMKPEKLSEVYAKNAKAGAGFIFTGAVTDEEEWSTDKFPKGRFLRQETVGFGIHGLSIAGVTDHVTIRLKIAKEMIRNLKKKTDVPVLVSVVPRNVLDPESWANLSETVQSYGADGVELDTSCPFAITEKITMSPFLKKYLPEEPVLIFGDFMEQVVDVAKEAVKSVNIPVGVKLDPQTGVPRVIALTNALKDVGVKWVAPSNASFGICPPDIWTGKTLWPALDHNTFGGALGPTNRWAMLRDVACISLYTPDMDLCGVGGHLTPEHIIQSIMLGAKICCYSFAILWRGRTLITKTVDFMKEYMDKRGYAKVEDFRGKALADIMSPEKIDWKLGKVVSKTNELLCNACGICANNVCMARSMEDGVAKVDEEDCGGCGICVAICPVNACTLIDFDTKEVAYGRKEIS